MVENGDRKPNGQFADGHAGGPGRPKGAWSGRRKILEVLDKILTKAKNLTALEKDLQKRFDKSPGGFVLTFGPALYPKSIELSSPDDKAGVRITTTTRPNENGKGNGEDADAGD